MPTLKRRRRCVAIAEYRRRAAVMERAPRHFGHRGGEARPRRLAETNQLGDIARTLPREHQIRVALDRNSGDLPSLTHGPVPLPWLSWGGTRLAARELGQGVARDALLGQHLRLHHAEGRARQSLDVGEVALEPVQLALV